MRFRNIKIVIILTILIIFLVGIAFWNQLLSSKKNKINPTISNLPVDTQFAKRSIPTPTPFFLEDLTIPGLRSRNYDSQLGELTKYEERTNYISYITSYDSDGLKVNGLLTIPKSPANSEGHPAIIFVHGYIAPSIYRTTEKYTAYVDYLARNGFVVFKIDLRGHGNSEGEAGGAYYSSDYVIDTLNAYSALQKSDFVNPEKIGLWGHSMAGNVTFRAFVAKQNIPALVVWAGAGYTYTDLSEYRLNDQSYRPPSTNTERARKRQAMRDAYGEYDPNHWFWKQVTPTNYLDGVSGAIELHHPVDDTVVSVEYSRNLIRVLNNTDIDHRLYEYPGGGHNLENPAFNLAMKRTVEFYERTLK